MSFFCVEQLCVGYGRRPVLQDISFTLESGRILGLLGANGSGKTTLLKAICGILPHSGQCSLDGCKLEGVSVREMAKSCSYIPQRSGISIDIAVLDVILMGFNPQLRLLQNPTAAMRQKACDALHLVGLSGMEEQNYMTLSEGQKQLCILARTICSDASLFLLDEPESALDFRFRYQVMEILRDRIAGKNAAAIVALHDPMLALNCCDELLLISNSKVLGRISPAVDSAEEMEQKLSVLYGPVNLVKCHTRSGSEALLMLREAVT